MPPKRAKGCTTLSDSQCRVRVTSKTSPCLFDSSATKGKKCRPAKSPRAVAKKSPVPKKSPVTKKSPVAKKSPGAKKSPVTKKSPGAKKSPKRSMETWSKCHTLFRKKSTSPNGRCINAIKGFKSSQASGCSDPSKYRLDRRAKKCRKYSSPKAKKARKSSK